MVTRHVLHSDILELQAPADPKPAPNAAALAAASLRPQDPTSAQLDSFMTQLYQAISFAEGDEPDWAAMDQLFLPDARLTRVTPEGTDRMDLAAFRQLCEEMLDIGVFTSFYEFETARQAQLFGSVTHVLSSYETRTHPEAADYISRGVNSIQLLKQDSGFRLLSLFWEENIEHATLETLETLNETRWERKVTQ